MIFFSSIQGVNLTPIQFPTCIFSNRLNDLNSLPSLNSILLRIAKRVNSNSLEKDLEDLLVIYDIDKATENDIRAITNENLQWVATNSDDIQDFLDDFFRSSSHRASTFPSFIIVFGLTFNWIMQN